VSQLETSLRMDPMSVSRPARLGNLGRALLLQSRFAEALPLLIEAAQQTESPTFVAYRAACLGHLGRIDEAKVALERARTLTPLSLEAMLREIVFDPDQRKLILEGIALAEAKRPADGAAGTP
jgi:tetratricopeptide (TPR) repeat protein